MSEVGPATRRAVAMTSCSGRTLGEVAPLVAGLATVKVAAARANGDAGVLAARTASVLATAAASLPERRAALVADPFGGGGSIAVHVNVNEVLGALAATELGGGADPAELAVAAGASQSTADVVHTAGRLAVLDAGDALGVAGREVLAAIERLAERFGDAPTLARTCLRDGLAVPARLLPDGWAATLRRRLAALDAALAPLHEVVLGATVVGDGSGAPDAYRAAVVPHLAAITWRPLVAHLAPASALQSADDLVAVAGAIAGVATALARVAADLRLLASGPAGGLGEVLLPHVMDGSSFFAGKSNPVVPETVLQAELLVRGHVAVVEGAAARAELHLGVFDLTAAVATVDAAERLVAAAGLFATHALDGAELDVDRCAELAASAAPTKTAPTPEAPR